LSTTRAIKNEEIVVMRDGGSSSSSSTTFIISVLIAVSAMMEESNGQPRVGLVLVLHNLVRYGRFILICTRQ
jgi:hypothetical protein